MNPFTKNIIITLLITLPIITLGACSGSSSNTKRSKVEGQYKFTMYDSLSNKLLNGDLYITKENDSSYKAGLDIKNKYKDFYSYGNMKTTNTYMNYRKLDGIVFINMNPSSTDDNLYITLKFKSNKLDGEWSHTTIAGNKGRGEFTAKKIN